MTAQPHPRDSVLIVDDPPETLAMLGDVLDQAGMTVLVAREGQQALSMLDRVTPDAILMDAIMPGLDGFETTRALKRSPAAQHIPVIFMTGLTETEHIVKAFAVGGVDYVTKPIVPDELIARVRVHLANARTSHGAQAALDASGRYLLAADPAGVITWCTPQASRILLRAAPSSGTGQLTLPAPAIDWLNQRLNAATTPESFSFADSANAKLTLTHMGQIGPAEILLRLSETVATTPEARLRERLSITAREAQVLLWTARGKSNRDIGEILKLSPRTVNKHLETIYAKLGVENRTAAAAIAMGVINELQNL